ncbi:MAG TPA: hypothetical protein P5571_00055 [Candidatus Krumholzibacteria bacterium]|nr:hypothetical protein [Candidatus Krumholzibacteria bacterium]HRX49747.1 hypothetical protein [Candidatus Krumholzibacteria bacterium]
MSRGMTTGCALALALTLLTAAEAGAASRWRLATPVRAAGEACVRVGGEAVSYVRLEEGAPAVLRVRGPRRLKIVTRHLAPPAPGDEAAYVVHATIDGRLDVDRPEHAPRALGADVCDGGAPAGALRRSYVTIPKGWHDVEVTASGGPVAARFYQERTTKEVVWADYAPERYASVGHLEFDSGARSAYYRFDAARPLSFEVSGPTEVEVWVRLDFDHTMSGVQPFALTATLDGEPWRDFHFDSDRLDSAVWIERPDVLPGERKTLRLKVPGGKHRVEIRCLKPEVCGMAAKIRIPERSIR